MVTSLLSAETKSIVSCERLYVCCAERSKDKAGTLSVIRPTIILTTTTATINIAVKATESPPFLIFLLLNKAFSLPLFFFFDFSSAASSVLLCASAFSAVSSVLFCASAFSGTASSLAELSVSMLFSVISFSETPFDISSKSLFSFSLLIVAPP